MALQSATNSCSAFIQKIPTAVASDPTGAVFFSLWLGFEVSELKTALANRRSAQEIVGNLSEKTQKIWDANRNLIESIASCFSTGGLLLQWMDKVRLIQLGPLFPIASIFGYGGRAIVSFSKLLVGIKDLLEGNYFYSHAKDKKTKDTLFYKSIGHLLKIAFHATFIAWGVFGIAFSILGGEVLQNLIDSLLDCLILLFMGNLTFAIATKPPRKKEIPPK